MAPSCGAYLFQPRDQGAEFYLGTFEFVTKQLWPKRDGPPQFTVQGINNWMSSK